MCGVEGGGEQRGVGRNLRHVIPTKGAYKHGIPRFQGPGAVTGMCSGALEREGLQQSSLVGEDQVVLGQIPPLELFPHLCKYLLFTERAAWRGIRNCRNRHLHSILQLTHIHHLIWSSQQPCEEQGSMIPII